MVLGIIKVGLESTKDGPSEYSMVLTSTFGIVGVRTMKYVEGLLMRSHSKVEENKQIKLSVPGWV